MMEIKQFPTDVSDFYEKIDPDDIYRTQLTGLFERRLDVGGVPRAKTFYIYIPERCYHSGPTAVLIPSEGQSVAEFLEKSGWKETADREGILLQIAEPGEDYEYIQALESMVRDRTYYNINKAYVYLAGYGTGAKLAQKLALEVPSHFAGAVCAGDYGMDESLLKEWGDRPSDYDFLPMRDVPLPMCLFSCPETEEENTAQQRTVCYWKHANVSREKPYEQDGLTIYMAREDTNASLIEETAGAPLMLGRIKTEDLMGKSDWLWELVSRYTRTTGIANGHLRPRRTLEAWGAERRTIRVDQYLRDWVEYIPSKVKRDPDYKAPVVVCFHGGGNRNEPMMASTEWVKVAEARSFIVLFPAGSMRRMADKGWMPHPAWNAGHVADIMDDEKLVKMMLEDVFSRFHVDRSRVYANGHSMGACMCQRAILALPEYFTAGASTGGVLKGGFFGYFDTEGVKETCKMPLWMVMGENDYNGGTYENPANGTKVNAEYWTKRNETQPVDEPLTYRNGLYYHKVYMNKQGVPMVQFTTVDYKPHCCTAQDSWFFYDEWFSKFSRKEDGTQVYLNGIEVK